MEGAGWMFDALCAHCRSRRPCVCTHGSALVPPLASFTDSATCHSETSVQGPPSARLACASCEVSNDAAGALKFSHPFPFPKNLFLRARRQQSRLCSALRDPGARNLPITWIRSLGASTGAVDGGSRKLLPLAASAPPEEQSPDRDGGTTAVQSDSGLCPPPCSGHALRLEKPDHELNNPGGLE